MLSTIAVGTDGTERAAAAVDFAIDLAKRYNARLVAISSYRPVTEHRLQQDKEAAPADVKWTVNPEQEVEDVLSGVERSALDAGIEVTTVAAQGDPAEVLVHHAGEQGADVIVVGNRGMERRVLGSIPNSVAHKAQCHVIVVKTA
jgi:nucleotide-binding universal stress UspA family protein